MEDTTEYLVKVPYQVILGHETIVDHFLPFLMSVL